MKSRVVGLFIFLIMFYSSVAFGQSAEVAVELVDALEAKLSWIDHRYAQEQWKAAQSLDSDSLEHFEHLHRYLLSDPELFDALHKADRRGNGDASARRLAILLPIVQRAYIDGRPHLYQLHDSIVTALNDPEASAGDAIGRLMRLRNQEAKRLGYNDYFSLTMDCAGSTREAYDKLVSDLSGATDSAFRSILGTADQSSGTADFDDEAWRSRMRALEAETRSYLPVDSQLIMVKRTVAGLGFDLENLPIYFSITAYPDLPAYAFSLTITPALDVRVVANLQPGLQSTRELLAAVIEAIQRTSVTQESPLLAGYQEPATSLGVRALFNRLLSSSSWLTTYAHFPRSLAERTEQTVRHDVIIRLRQKLVATAFEQRAYQNPGQDLDRLYQEIAGRLVAAPRGGVYAAWASDQDLVGAPFSGRDQLQGEIIGAQTYQYLMNHYGQILGNPEMRSFLVHNFFRFGSRYAWPELLERATGQNPNPAFVGR